MTLWPRRTQRTRPLFRDTETEEAKRFDEIEHAINLSLDDLDRQDAENVEVND